MADNKDNVFCSDTAARPVLKSGYFARTARHVYALIYLFPFIVLYEVLVLIVNPQLLKVPLDNIRGGVVAFVWLQNLLQYIGMDTRSAWLAAPFVVVLILLILQITSSQSWKVIWFDFLPMTFECILFSIPLIVFAVVLNRSVVSDSQAFFVHPVPACRSVSVQQDGSNDNFSSDSNGFQNQFSAESVHPLTMNIITGIGAGIYEELIFRLILISGFMLFFETVIGLDRLKSIIISVLLSATLFSLYHHFVFLNGQFAITEFFTLRRFAFRAIAGVYFAVIFAVRGFGITAATHAFYDIIAAILNAVIFN